MDRGRKKYSGSLTTGEHAATKDPMVMSWSHVYLGRVFEDEGDLDAQRRNIKRRWKYEGAPAQAQQAAKKGLGDLEVRKPVERP